MVRRRRGCCANAPMTGAAVVTSAAVSQYGWLYLAIASGPLSTTMLSISASRIAVGWHMNGEGRKAQQQQQQQEQQQ